MDLQLLPLKRPEFAEREKRNAKFDNQAEFSAFFASNLAIKSLSALF